MKWKSRVMKMVMKRRKKRLKKKELKKMKMSAYATLSFHMGNLILTLFRNNNVQFL